MNKNMLEKVASNLSIHLNTKVDIEYALKYVERVEKWVKTIEYVKMFSISMLDISLLITSIVFGDVFPIFAFIVSTFISIIVIYESMQRLTFIEEYVYKKIINDDINNELWRGIL